MQLKSERMKCFAKNISLNNYNKQDFLKSVRNAKVPDKDKSVFIRQIPSVILTQILEFIKKKKLRKLENAKQRI